MISHKSPLPSLNKGPATIARSLSSSSMAVHSFSAAFALERRSRSSATSFCPCWRRFYNTVLGVRRRGHEGHREAKVRRDTRVRKSGEAQRVIADSACAATTPNAAGTLGIFDCCDGSRVYNYLRYTKLSPPPTNVILSPSRVPDIVIPPGNVNRMVDGATSSKVPEPPNVFVVVVPSMFVKVPVVDNTHRTVGIEGN